MMKERNDFARLRHALELRGRLGRPPVVELHVDRPVKEAYLGRPIAGPADEAEFWVGAGYDAVPVAVGILQVGGVAGGQVGHKRRGQYTVYGDGESEIQWASEGQGVIRSLDEVRSFAWPNPEQIDLSALEQIEPHLPPEMGLIAVIGKVFTPTWMLLGFEGFAEAWAFNRELVAAVFERVIEIQWRTFERAIALPRVVGIWHPDDLAYGTGLLCSPAVFREFVFPVYRRMGEVCRERGLSYVFHSDGDLRPVLDDLIACGFQGLHPLEPQAMDAREVKALTRGQLCLLGNIDVDRLARGTPEEIKALVRANIRDLTDDGGYCVGSANSVTYYVPLANYQAMLEAAFEG